MLAVMIAMMVATQAPPAADEDARVRGCSRNDTECLRREYSRLQTVLPPCEGPGCPDAEEITGTDQAPWKLPWWGVAPAQWCATIGTDFLPAAVLTLAAVFAIAGIVLPGSTIPTLLAAGLGCGLVPCLPVVQGVATNLVGDILSQGPKRGRLVVQVLASTALLGVQLGVAALGAVLTAALLNNLFVALVVPQLRYVPATCIDFENNYQACIEQAGAAATGASLLVGAAGLGMLAIIGTNLVVAGLVKGPLLALAYQLHATAPLPEPYPSFLPRLVRAPEREAPVVTVAAPVSSGAGASHP